jgi:hypothetical protein
MVLSMSYLPAFENDVFVSYAHADNLPDAIGQRFVTLLVHGLNQILAARLGFKPRIFFSEDTPFSNQDFEHRINQIRSSAVLLAVLSPSYFSHPTTIEELRAFSEATSDGRRIVAVETYPWEKTEENRQFQNFKRTLFWRADEVTEAIVGIDLQSNYQIFAEKVHETAHRIVALMREMKVAVDTHRSESPTDRQPTEEQGISFREAGAFPKNTSSHIFVSYSNLDRQITDDIVGRVEKAGLKCWVAGRDIRIGDNFQDAIVEALETASAMILVFSNQANGSSQIKNELALASEYGLWVLPVRIEDIEPKKGFKYELATRQYYDLFVDRESGMRSIIAALKRHKAPMS